MARQADWWMNVTPSLPLTEATVEVEGLELYYRMGGSGLPLPAWRQRSISGSQRDTGIFDTGICSENGGKTDAHTARGEQHGLRLADSRIVAYYLRRGLPPLTTTPGTHSCGSPEPHTSTTLDH